MIKKTPTTTADSTDTTPSFIAARPPTRFFRKYFAWILIVLVIALAGATTYFYKKSRANPAQEEAKDLAAEVGRIILLPADELPTVATVSDPEALKSQAFFADAKKGDKVLIYTNAKKAVLYDPVAKKIINVAPLNIGESQKTSAVPKPVTVTAPTAEKTETTKKN
ncbi:MAG TPA: hypothetical protein VLB02_01595 [Candidatus Paceibacterota bacterium]|nr:hypothetical protein [Candidatus Paceibacterota bacterium]